MSGLPWDPDRNLDVGIVSRVVTRQFPDFGGKSVRYLASGWDNDCYLLDEEWVFRFPRREEVVDWIRKEVALSPIVADALDLRTPRIEITGRPDEEFPYPFVAYRLLPGIPWEWDQPIDEDYVCGQLGEALTQLHSIDPPAAVPVTEWTPEDDLLELQEDREEVEALLPVDSRDLWQPFLDGTTEMPRPFPGPMRLIHNDLSPEHILIDPKTGRLTGIIDFGDAELGDPARDIAFFNYLFRNSFTDKVISRYGLHVDDGFAERMRFFPHVRSAIWLLNAYQGGDPLDFEKHLKTIRAHARRLRAATVPGDDR